MNEMTHMDNNNYVLSIETYKKNPLFHRRS